MVKTYFRKQIALPQDHGSWVFLFSPLLIGLYSGGSFNPASAALVMAALAAFLVRQPLTVAVKALSGRRPKSDLPSALFWVVVYGVMATLGVLGLIYTGYAQILWLAVPAAPIFGWHLWLVSQRNERRQAGIEMMATGVLALAATGADWVGFGAFRPQAGWLWALTWFQSAASIVYAYLRLEQRDWKSIPALRTRFRAARRALLYTEFNALAAFTLGVIGILPHWIFIPFALQAAETLWGTIYPATGWKPTAIGIRQLIVSTLFTVLFMVFWR